MGLISEAWSDLTLPARLTGRVRENGLASSAKLSRP
jgi:hypothetical protein